MLKNFVRWMRYNPPSSQTWDGWADFKQEYRKNAPIRFFIMKKALPILEMNGIRRKLTNIRRWVSYRTTDRYHVVNTGLPPGYHDTDELLLHACFNLLVDYVEIELAWMHIVFDKEEYNKAMGWWRFVPRIFRFRNFRNRDAGLAHLDWEATLDSADLSEDAQAPDQARRARIVKDLYLWWKDVRPTRQEHAYPENGGDGFHSLSDRWCAEHPEEAKAVSDWARATFTQEEAWDKEDTDKLVELMKIRKGLWT